LPRRAATPDSPLGMSVDDLPSLALLALVGKFDVVGDNVDRRGFFGRDEVGQYGPDDRGHAADRSARKGYKGKRRVGGRTC
jgi:hypothetical protein